MTVDLNSDVLLTRLRRAREDRGLSQQDVADELGVARTTVIAIEAGQRRLRADELLAFARLYDERLDELLRDDIVARPLAAQFRYATNRATQSQELNKGAAELQSLAESSHKLEELMDAPMVFRYPPEQGVPSGDLDRQAALLADAERRRLALGDGPLPHLRETLEDDVGIRVFSIELPSQLGGLFAADEVLGACIAINAQHRWERQRWSLAHEYGHFLTRRGRPEVTVAIKHYQRVPASERFADHFARHLLLPADGITRRWKSGTPEPKATVGTLVVEADRWGVSVQAFVLRLEQLRLVRSGTYDSLLERGLAVDEARTLLGLPPRPADTATVGRRTRALALTAYRQGLLSEERLARTLRLDRLATRHLLAPVAGDEIE